MIACLSPNGGTVSSGEEPVTTLLVATIRGLHILRREGPGAPWKRDGARLERKPLSSLLYEPSSHLLFAGVHGRGADGGLLASPDLGASWEERMNGLNTSHIYTLAAQQRPEGVALYAGAEPAELYRSSNLGGLWEDLSGLREVPGTEHWIFPPPPHIAHVKNVAFHPHEPDTLYVAVEQGAALKSVDGGRNWTEMLSYVSGEDAFYRDIHRIVIAHNDPRRLYMATGDGLYSSPDAGDSWAHLQRGDDRIGYPDALFVDPRDDDVIYMGGAGGSPETWRKRGGAFPGFIVSRNRGESWAELMDGLPQPIIGNIEAMAMHAWPAGLAFYIGTAVGDVFASEDGGASWSQIAEGLPPISKSRHYRHFLSAEEKLRLEEEGRAERAAAGLAPRDYSTNA